MALETNTTPKSSQEVKISSKIAVHRIDWIHNIVNVLLAFSISAIGGFFIGFQVLLLLLPVQLGVIEFLALSLLFPIIVTIIAIMRNRILEIIYDKVSPQGYLLLARFWRFYPFLVMTIVTVLFIPTVLLANNLNYVLLSPIIFGLFLPFYFIFEFSLTYEGEIRILFAGLNNTIDHFYKRQFYWRAIAKKISRLLRAGNIEISEDELIYHFNKMLWETNTTITKQLKEIESWLLDESKSCSHAIRQLLPEICFQPVKKTQFFKQIASNPTTTQADIIKWLSLAIIVIIFSVLILVHPELGTEILNHLPWG